MIEEMRPEILQIIVEGDVVARGASLANAVLTFQDDETSIISYPDTGVFILFKGSVAASTDEKYRDSIGSDGRTNREIVFQSRNAAAEFVLGEGGRTNYWV